MKKPVSIQNISSFQREYFQKGITKNKKFRIEQLQRLKQSIIQNEADIYSALKNDLGKSEVESFMAEVGFVINEIDYMLKNLWCISKPQKSKTPLMFFGSRSFIMPEPYGSVLIIGPWNYPFQLIMLPLVGAIAAGNSVVVKPSELAINTSKIVTTIINNTFNDEYVASIEGGVEETQILLAQKFDYIFYTGSTAVGKIIMQAAAKNLTPVTLELGGKSPCIVDKDANLMTVARRIVYGKFMNSGQTCVAPDYIFVHKSIKKELVINIIKAINEFYGDNPIENEEYSNIINKKHFDRLLLLMSDGKILHGGKSNATKLKIEPTIIDSMDMNSRIMQDEIFGPLLPILEFDNLAEVIFIINQRPKALALYYFSNNKANISKILNDTSSGGVCINDTINHIVNRNLPFGGVGESGMGNYHGRATFDTFSHKKSVLKNQILFDIKMKYPPSRVSVNFLRKIMKFLLN